SRLLSCREFHGNIAPPRSLTSYSALASAGFVEAPDRDGGYPTAAGEAPAEDSSPAAGAGIVNFPAGARAGTFFHAIFETLDFTRPDSRTVVSRKLHEYGFEPSWTEPVCSMVADVLAMPLFGGASALRLSEVSLDRRVSEMEFCFPLNRVTPDLLEEVFARHRTPSVIAGTPAAEGIERLHFAPTHGFMKGFIDLVFESGGRYYLVDWKSNRLGASPEAYRRDQLRAAMREHHYDLQYHIYTLALHQYLRLRVPGYEYDRDFGGVCYVFLRGVSCEFGPGYGLFSNRPEPRLVHALAEALRPAYD
ncbi:partial RecBCD enzyme subunit RecB, partial [Anaerolineae bacterium]